MLTTLMELCLLPPQLFKAGNATKVQIRLIEEC